MKKSYVLPTFSFLIGSLLLGGCAHIPEKMQVTDNSPLTSFAEVKSQPNADVGLSARWGGVIAKVENQQSNTMIEVVNFKLLSSTRPKVTNETQGRFRFYYKGLLDPIIYKKGKSITVVGTVAPSEKGKIGKYAYLYPVIKATNVHLWKRVQRVDVNITQQPLWNNPFYWNSPYYWNSYPISYTNSTVIRQSNSNSNRTSINTKPSSKH